MRAVRSKQRREQCEQMNEWPSTLRVGYVHFLPEALSTEQMQLHYMSLGPMRVYISWVDNCDDMRTNDALFH